MTKERVFLLGMMGAGKSYWGRLLALHLGWEFIDLDELIESGEQKSISAIFETGGEAEFRRIEAQYLASTFSRERVIVATGGGAPCFFNNLDAMQQAGLTIYIRQTVSELVGNLSGRTRQRPLLQQLEPEQLQQHLAQLLGQRSEFYEQAAVVLDRTSPDFETALFTAVTSRFPPH